MCKCKDTASLCKCKDTASLGIQIKDERGVNTYINPKGLNIIVGKVYLNSCNERVRIQQLLPDGAKVSYCNKEESPYKATLTDLSQYTEEKKLYDLKNAYRAWYLNKDGSIGNTLFWDKCKTPSSTLKLIAVTKGTVDFFYEGEGLEEPTDIIEQGTYSKQRDGTIKHKVDINC